METKYVLKGNKLIAEFMLNKKGDYFSGVPFGGGGWIIKTDDKEELNNFLKSLKFHSSWDWLMPVVEKIWGIIGNRENLFYFDISDLTMVENKTIFSNSPLIDNITDCYNVVVEFIKWYNQNKPKLLTA
jgi:hypothetical protein